MSALQYGAERIKRPLYSKLIPQLRRASLGPATNLSEHRKHCY